MTAALAVLRARAAEQRLWASTCVITRPSPNVGGLLEGSLTYEAPVGATIYNGSCQVRVYGQDADAEQQLGGQDIAKNTYLVKVPIDTGVARGDLVAVIASSDPDLLNRTFVVMSIPASEWAGARRLVCLEVSP